MDQLFLHHLHGVHLVVLLQAHQQNFGVAASSDHSDQLKVRQTQSQILGQLHAADAIDHRADVLQVSKRVDECVQRERWFGFDLLTSDSSVLASIRSCAKKTETNTKNVVFIWPVGGAGGQAWWSESRGC